MGRLTKIKLTTKIYDYVDFRFYLRDLTQEMKVKQKSFNLRSFAQKANLRAPGYLKMIIEGKRRLTHETLEGFCEALKITGREKRYFEKLVVYNQTDDPEKKTQYFEELNTLRPHQSKYILEKHQNKYLTHDYYVCIREMVALKDFCEDYNWIADRCQPNIKPQQAKEAVETLLALGLLARNKSKQLIQAESFVQTEDKNARAIEAYHFHQSMLNKASLALVYLQQENRDYYALTLPIPLSLLPKIVHDFYEFRDKIVDIVNQHKEGYDEVYQINFQFFPLTKKVKS